MPKLGDGVMGKPLFGPSVLPILSYSLYSLAQFKHNYSYFQLGLLFLSDPPPPIILMEFGQKLVKYSSVVLYKS